MNLVKNQTLHQHLRDDEALVVENAIRLAIDSIINVLCGVNSARSREQQRMVADRDREIRRLEARLTDLEHELKVIRRQGCSCRLSDEPQTGEQGGFEAAYTAAELEAEQQECEMSISVGLFARPSSHVSSQSLESAVPSPLSGPGPGPGLGLDQSCTSRSSESSETAIVIKEEPCDVDAVLIKWEMSEERSREIQESSQDPASPTLQRNLCNVDRSTLGENLQEDSGRLCDAQELQLRNKKKGVPMSELTEEAQKLKRAAWRAASRRYYARKVARQQANPSRPGPGPFSSRPGPFPSRPGPFPSRPGPFPSRPGPFPHITDSHYPQSVSLVDRRRRSLISELPEDSQSQQREAWRAASRRYYARKTSRPVTDPNQYQHLLHSLEPSGETLGPNSGGIMCS